MSTGIEETLVIVKPDGVARNLTGEILRRIEAKGYSLVDIRMVQPDREILAKHYAEDEGSCSRARSSRCASPATA